MKKNRARYDLYVQAICVDGVWRRFTPSHGHLTAYGPNYVYAKSYKIARKVLDERHWATHPMSATSNHYGVQKEKDCSGEHAA